ncbi:MAG: hypothetical protein IJ215_05295 [Clostridia bacterium]|nr:hypothetical protein [Clostridia bacterium]
MPEEEISIYMPGHDDDTDCKEIVEKFVSLEIPVKVSPDVEVKHTKSECCGRAIIVPSRHHKYEMGKEDNDCEFTIVQKMKIEIPVKFKVKTDVKDPFIDCELKKDDDKKEERL